MNNDMNNTIKHAQDEYITILYITIYNRYGQSVAIVTIQQKRTENNSDDQIEIHMQLYV